MMVSSSAADESQCEAWQWISVPSKSGRRHEMSVPEHPTAAHDYYRRDCKYFINLRARASTPLNPAQESQFFFVPYFPVLFWFSSGELNRFLWSQNQPFSGVNESENLHRRIRVDAHVRKSITDMQNWRKYMSFLFSQVLKCLFGL